MKKAQILAILSGAATFFLVMTMGGNSSDKELPEVELERVSVVAASAEILPYTEITGDMLYIKELEADAVHQDAVYDLDEVIGRINTITIFADEVILRRKIVEKKSASAGLAFNIESGKRAITVLVDEKSGVGNNLRVGNWVDILSILPSDLPDDVMQKYNTWAQNYPELFSFLLENGNRNADNNARIVSFSQTSEPKSLMLLQNVKILSLDSSFITGDHASMDGTGYHSVTLEVTPEQALAINLADCNYNVRLILREQKDHETAEAEGVTMHDLLGVRGNQ